MRLRSHGSVQQMASVGSDDGQRGPGKQARTSSVHAAAQRGIETPSGPLPHGESIQASFGHHDVSGIHAHVGGDAREATASMGASAYATGDHVVFGDSPDLHTAAHEAAHVVQQRGGVHLLGGVGESGDPYEQHADAVADKVVAGQSAAGLLDTMAPRGHREAGVRPLQMRRVVAPEITQPTLALIERVVAADPVLSAMWAWIVEHEVIQLDILPAQGSPSTDAKPGATNIALKLKPEKANQQAGAEMLGTISHELILHMLPWARAMMNAELPTARGRAPAQISTVLRAAMGSPGLDHNLRADQLNKLTTSFGGNHSDLALWSQHMTTVLAIARQEKEPQQTEIAATAIDKMYWAVMLTGLPKDAIDRGRHAFGEFERDLARLAAYIPNVQDASRRSFLDKCIEAIRKRAREVEDQARANEDQVFPASFEAWIARLDALCRADLGMKLSDLPDHDYRSGFRQQITPRAYFGQFLSGTKGMTGEGQPRRQQGMFW